MKHILFVIMIAAIAVLSSCKDSLPSATTTVVHDTLYRHYWDPEQSGVSASLIAVRFSTLKSGAAVGTGGTVVTTSNGGDTWMSGYSASNEDLYGLSFGDPNTGIADGDFGAVMKTTDGGIHWTPLSVDIDVQFRNVQMVGSNTAYVIGTKYFDVDNTKGYIYKTTDGGSTWSAQTIASAPGLYGISFIDAQNGWVSGLHGMIYKTTDGGATWTKQNSTIPVTQQVSQIAFTDASHGIAVGVDGIAGVPGIPSSGFTIITSDGGATWTKTSSYPVSGLWMADANHAEVVGYSGRVMETADGGATWSTSYVGSGRLFNIFLNDANNGAMVGENGEIYILGPH